MINSPNCSTVSTYKVFIPHLTISSWNQILLDSRIILDTRSELGFHISNQYQSTCILIVNRNNYCCIIHRHTNWLTKCSSNVGNGKQFSSTVIHCYYFCFCSWYISIGMYLWNPQNRTIRKRDDKSGMYIDTCRFSRLIMTIHPRKLASGYVSTLHTS